MARRTREQLVADTIAEALYMVATECTIREAAAHFGRCHSSVHYDLEHHLEYADPELHKKLKKVLKRHKEERHHRGGATTSRLYAELRALRNQR